MGMLAEPFEVVADAGCRPAAEPLHDYAAHEGSLPTATLSERYPRRVETEIARLARDWNPRAISDIWHPVRTAGLGDRDTLGARVRADLQAEPELVDSWAAYSQDKRFTPSWALEGRRVTWVSPSTGTVRGPTWMFDDEVEACAEFILRDALWSVERRFVDVVAGPLNRSWSLMDDDRFLALLTVTDSDFPWLNATLAPAPAFESWRPVFDDERRALDKIDDDPEAWEAAYDIVGNALTLRDPDGNDVEAFLLHINGDAAWWRWA